MFTCSKCGGDFAEDMRATGYRRCKPCQNAIKRGYHRDNRETLLVKMRQRRVENGERYNANRRAKYASDPVYAEAIKAAAIKWGQDNAERKVARTVATHKKRMATDSEYAERRRATNLECVNMRRVAKRATLAQHFREELKRIYAECPEGYEVDHIHPLLGENFSGLHVPWNLQYLPRRENRKKSNRMVA